jgi:hypothetical protein
VLLDHVAGAPAETSAPHDIASLRLVCLVRAGDGYVVRAVGRIADAGDTRQHLDITFGDAVGRGRSSELETAVRQVQRWCEDGTPVALVDGGGRLALRAGDGTEVSLPRPA